MIESTNLSLVALLEKKEEVIRFTFADTTAYYSSKQAFPPVRLSRQGETGSPVDDAVVLLLNSSLGSVLTKALG